jgi:hypothetical protein
MTRLARTIALGVLLAGATAFASTPSPQPYHVVASLASVMNGRPLSWLVFDRQSNKLFAASVEGVYTADLAAPKPQMSGPIVKAHASVIEVAPDLGRVFYGGVDGIGWVPERGGAPVQISDKFAWDLVYEPTHHEIYASFQFLPYVMVFDARTGERRAVLNVPGWNASQLEAVPGKVFMLVGGKNGVFTIDANTRAVSPWEVDGKLITPGMLQADPSGRYLFMARPSEIDQIDIATHRIVGKAAMFGMPSISFDAANGKLVAAWPEETFLKERLIVFQPGADGLKQVAQLTNTTGGIHLIRTNHGFIQHGDHAFLVWKAE